VGHRGKSTARRKLVKEGSENQLLRLGLSPDDSPSLNVRSFIEGEPIRAGGDVMTKGANNTHHYSQHIFTDVQFRHYLSGLLIEVGKNHGIEFAARYPNTAVYTDQVKGTWGHEILQELSVRLFRWLRQDTHDVRIDGPDSSETFEEFDKRFRLEIKAAIEKLKD
jgi:hypothetical protein